MTDDAVKEYLEHYGVKGMKWGIRRKRGSDGRVSGPKKTSRGRTIYQKTPDRLSEAELQRRIKRLELEKKYRDLNTPTVTKGKKFASETIQNTGRSVIGTVVGTTASFAVSRALNKKFANR